MRSTLLKATLAAMLLAAGGSSFAQTGASPAAPATAPADQPTAVSTPDGRAAPIGAAEATTPAAPEPQPTDSNAQRTLSQPLNNAPFWRGVHDSGRAPGSVNNLQLGERGVLIQPTISYPGTRTTSAGEAWRQIRNWWIVPYGGALVVIVVFALALFFFAKGPIEQHEPDTGRLIERFTYFERAAHWSNAIAFCVLAISGLVMAFGKFLLLPLIGGALFGWLTWALKTAHNFAGPLFAISLVIVFFTFLRSNWPTRDDFAWLMRAGGMLGGKEPPSHRFNAGEKIVFWGGVLVLGSIVVGSGLVLDKIIPGLDPTRPDMQLAHIVHSIAAVFIIAMFLGHIYMGTIGMRGAYRAMKTGYVDESWARDHHRLWYDDIAAGDIPAQRSLPPRGIQQPAA